MEKSGTVIALNGSIATIKILRDSACGENCAACGLCQNRELTVKLLVDDDIKFGDNVKLISEDKHILKSSALLYLVLTLLLILGGFLGAIFDSDWISFILSVVFVLVGIAVFKVIPKKDAPIHVEKL